MKAYSLDLRERVIAMLQEGEFSQPQIAEHFQISVGTVENWWRRWRVLGHLAPHAGSSGPDRTLEPCASIIRRTVRQQPDATLEELCDAVYTQTGVRASPSMMCRELQQLNLPRKKVTPRQSPRQPARPNPAAHLSNQDSSSVARSRRTLKIHR
jgi:transposase